MKKLMILLVFLFAVPCVLAAEGNITVDYFKVYVDNDRIDSDWEDDYFKAEAGKDLEIQIKLQNDYSQDIEVNLDGSLDIGETIDRDEKETIGGGDDRSFVLSYYIPVDTREDSYEFEARYTYSVNGTDYSHKRTFDVDVRADEVDEENILINLTEAILDERDESNELTLLVINLTQNNNELGVCKEALGALSEANESRNQFERWYQEEKNDSSFYKVEYTECSTAKKSMYTQAQLDSKIIKAKNEQKNSSNQMMMLVLLIGGGFYWYQQKKKKVGGSGESEPIAGSWK